MRNTYNVNGDKNKELNDESPEKSGKSSLFSQSEIPLLRPSITPEELEEQLDFEVSDETALMIDDLNNPHQHMNPANFTEEQKWEWIRSMKLDLVDQ
jgi:hypothetical protein